MKSVKIAWVVFMLAVGGYLFGAAFTDLDTLQHQGKTGLKDLVTGIDANFAMLEDGSVTIATIQNTTLISNATLKVYGQKLEVIAGGTVTIPAASLDAAGLSGDVAAAQLATNMKAAISNLFTSVSIGGTNYYMLAYP